MSDKNNNAPDRAVDALVGPSGIDGLPADITAIDTKCTEYKVYKIRWFILVLFILYSTLSAMHWNQYNVIGNIIQRYYNVDHEWVEWTAITYSAFYIVFIVPSSWLLDRKGLRFTVICGAMTIFVGSWIKVFSVQRNLFYLGFVGQCMLALSCNFILSLPSAVAAVWFGPDQVSTACSLGVFGSQLGFALGFLMPSLMVHNHEDLNVVGNDLRFMFSILAVAATALLVVILFFFQDMPKSPPSAAQEASQMMKGSKPMPFRHSIKRLLVNRNYMMLLLSYGMNVGIFYALSTLMNPLILKYFPGREADVGRIGVCFIVAGMFGAVCTGIILDKTQRFKETTLIIYGLTMLGMWIYTFSFMGNHIVVVYGTTIILGFFMAGYLPVGFEFAAELTFPESEGTVAGLMNWSTELSGLIFTVVYSKLFYNYSDFAANGTMGGILVVGTIITFLIYPDLRRQAAYKNCV